MILETFYEPIPGLTLYTKIFGALGILAILITLTIKYFTRNDTLAGVPELKGPPLLGSAPFLFKHGASSLIERLVHVGNDGVAFTKVGPKYLLSLHSPELVKEVSSVPDHIISRYIFISLSQMIKADIPLCRAVKRIESQSLWHSAQIDR